jgi:hypothetical protein
MEVILQRSLDLIMIVGPNLGFVAQISKFRQMKSSDGFSKFISFILIIANIFRIFFWVGKRFNVILLFQSISQILMQIYVLRECLIHSIHDKKNKEGYLQNFWNWSSLSEYVGFLSGVSVLLVVISQLVGFDNSGYIETLGFLSAGIEAGLGLPQVISNYKNRTTESLSIALLINWTLGDVFKTFYFINTNSPLQMILCGVIQLLIDFILIIQLVYYTYILPKRAKKE